jgi:hypothetical protein
LRRHHLADESRRDTVVEQGIRAERSRVRSVEAADCTGAGPLYGSEGGSFQRTVA